MMNTAESHKSTRHFSRASSKRTLRSMVLVPFFGMLCFSLTMFSFLPSAFCRDIRTVELAAFHYPPFYYEEEGRVQGIAVDLIRELFSRMNIRADITIYPLQRALNYLRSGKSDGIMILIKTPEREKFLHYTDPVLTVRGLIWSAADKKNGPVDFTDFEDLSRYKIGITRGYSYGKEFDAFLKTQKPDTAKTDYNNYRKLIGHRIDIFPGNEIVARGLFKQHPELQGKVVHSNKSFIEWPLHMGISRKSPLASKLKAINNVLSDMNNEGYINRTVNRYTQ